MPDQLSALVPKKKRNRAFLIPEKGVGTGLSGLRTRVSELSCVTKKTYVRAYY